MKGVRPKALSRVGSKELAEFISYCIQPRSDRPRSRQLLKHAYFDSIRAERNAVKLSAEALGLPIPAPECPVELADYANSAGSSSVSRSSSAAGNALSAKHRGEQAFNAAGSWLGSLLRG